MSLLIKLLLPVIFLVSAFTTTSQSVLAIESPISPSLINENTPTVTITFSELALNRDFIICRNSDRDHNEGYNNNCNINDRIDKNSGSNGVIRITVCGDGNDKVKEGCGEGDYFHDNNYKIYLIRDGTTVHTATFTVGKYFPEISFSPNSPTLGQVLTVTIIGHRRPANNSGRNKYDFDLFGTGSLPDPSDPDDLVVPGTDSSASRQFGDDLDGGTYILDVYYNNDHDFVLYQIEFTVSSGGGSYQITQNSGAGGNSITPGDQLLITLSDDPKSGAIDTPFGGVPRNPQGIASAFVSIAIGIAGGLAFLLMVYGGFRMIFSNGDPKAIQDAREIITSAIIGLIVIVFSVVLLRLIGISILGLPI